MGVVPVCPRFNLEHMSAWYGGDPSHSMHGKMWPERVWPERGKAKGSLVARLSKHGGRKL